MGLFEDSIQKTKQGFEKRFVNSSFYNKQTHDKHHLEMILDSLEIKPGMKVLDLGTGKGYVAFPLARRNPQTNIIGLDIIKIALEKNAERAETENIQNLSFINYDGKKFPLEDGTIDLVLTRYALHHFPDIEFSFKEIGRVLKSKGKLFIADPTPTKEDNKGFIDKYMQLFNDGHIKYYTKEEFISLAENINFKYINNFETSIRFPKEKENAVSFDALVGSYDKNITDSYDIEVTPDEIYMSQPVNNLLFEKNL